MTDTKATITETVLKIANTYNTAMNQFGNQRKMLKFEEYRELIQGTMPSCMTLEGTKTAYMKHVRHCLSFITY